MKGIIYTILGSLFVFAAAQPIAMSIHTGLKLDYRQKPKYPKPQKPPEPPEKPEPIPPPQDIKT